VYSLVLLCVEMRVCIRGFRASWKSVAGVYSLYEARLGCVDLSCSGTVRTAPSTMFVRPAVAHSTFGAKHRMALGGTSADLRMLSSKPAGSSIDANEEQPSKAPLPMLVRLAGSSIDVIEEQ
jgi:hypothetical protein